MLQRHELQHQHGLPMFFLKYCCVALAIVEGMYVYNKITLVRLQLCIGRACKQAPGLLVWPYGSMHGSMVDHHHVDNMHKSSAHA